MSFSGVKVNKLNGNLGGAAANKDGIVAVAIPLAAGILPAGVTHYGAKKLLQAEDATAIGFSASYDANNLKMVYAGVSEFFRLAPEAELHLIPVPDNLTVTQLVGTEAFKSALRSASDVKGLAIAIEADVAATFAHAEAVQGMINSFAAEYRLLDFAILPARGNAVAYATIADYPDFRTKNAPNVTPCIAQDPAVAGLDATFAKYADWSAALAMVAVRQVNENAGSVNISKKPAAKRGEPDYPLTSDTRWLEAALSSGVKVNTLSAIDKKALTAKGYMYAGSYDGYGGVFLNSSPTAVALTSDYSYIERNRVWNKAARAIRQILIPEVKGVVKKDPTTGYIKATTISRWTGQVSKALEAMQSADEISGFSVYINPKQVLSETSPLKVQGTVVSDDIVHEFDVDLGLANKI